MNQSLTISRVDNRLIVMTRTARIKIPLKSVPIGTVKNRYAIVGAALNAGRANWANAADHRRRLRALNPELRCSNEQLLEMVKTGSASDKMADLITLKEDVGLEKLKLFLERTDGLSSLLDVLGDEPAAVAGTEDNQLDWRSALWELLLFVLHNREALGLDERDFCSTAIIARVLLLMKTETDRRRALQFLLTEPNCSSTCQAAIVESGGIPLLVDLLRSERDDETVALMLELLHGIAASSASHVQEIDLLVQNIVNCSHPMSWTSRCSCCSYTMSDSRHTSARRPQPTARTRSSCSRCKRP